MGLCTFRTSSAYPKTRCYRKYEYAVSGLYDTRVSLKLIIINIHWQKKEDAIGSDSSNNSSIKKIEK